jgi:hypothetical protein
VEVVLAGMGRRGGEKVKEKKRKVRREVWLACWRQHHYYDRTRLARRKGSSARIAAVQGQSDGGHRAGPDWWCVEGCWFYIIPCGRSSLRTDGLTGHWMGGAESSEAVALGGAAGNYSPSSPLRRLLLFGPTVQHDDGVAVCCSVRPACVFTDLFLDRASCTKFGGQGERAKGLAKDWAPAGGSGFFGLHRSGH